MKKCFTSYKGEHDEEEYLTYIKKRVKGCFPKGKTVYIEVTTATDTATAAATILKVRDILLNSSLAKGGIV